MMITMVKALLFILYITNCVSAIMFRMTDFHRQRDPPEDMWDNIELLVSCSKVGQLLGRFAIAFDFPGIFSLIAIFAMSAIIINFIPPIKQFCKEISEKPYQKTRIVIMTWLLLRH